MWEKIKDSIKSVLFGILLFFASLGVIFFNECNAVKDTARTEEAGEISVSVSSDNVDSSNNGQLVHMNGEAQTTETLTDSTFGISQNAIKLSRDVQMYQWRESEKTKEVNGKKETTYEYEQVWSSSPISSNNFKKQGHYNPPMQYQGQTWQARNVTLGAFRLGPLVDKMSDYEDYSVSQSDLAKLPPNLSNQATLNDGEIFISTNGNSTPSSPKVGDYRVSFRVITPGPYSLIAQQNGNSFKPFMHENEKETFKIYAGTLSKEEVIGKMESEDAMLRWGLRIGSIVFMAIALIMMFNPLKEVADMVPLVGNFLEAGIVLFAIGIALFISFISIAIAWLVARPLLGILLIVVAIAAIVGLVFIARSRKSNKPADAGAAG